MHATPTCDTAATVAVDLAKDVFQLAFAAAPGQRVAHQRLSRAAFAHAFDNVPPRHIVMEACGSAHHWARHFQRLGHTVTLLPALAVRPYVRGNKTDRTDAAGLLEAVRCGDIRPVPAKTCEAQGIQGLHRAREFHKAHRTAAINLLRGLLREFGIVIPLGSAKVRPAVLAALEDAENDLPMALRAAIQTVLDIILDAEHAVAAIETELDAFARRDLRSQRLQVAGGGVGLITATALSASVGELERFGSGRHFASYLGLTPREYSSGKIRRLGRVTKRGDVYLRMLLIHGARRPAQRQTRAETTTTPRPHPRLGARPRRTRRPQHGRRRLGQQNRTPALGRRTSSQELRPQPPQRVSGSRRNALTGITLPPRCIDKRKMANVSVPEAIKPITILANLAA